MGSKFWFLAVLLLEVSVGVEAFPIETYDYPIDFESDNLLDDSTERDGINEYNYEMDYPGVEDDVDDEDDDDGNELDNFYDDSEMEDYEGALDEMGLMNPLWDQALRLPRPRDRRPRSLRSKRKKKKGGSKRQPRKGGKKKSSHRKGGKKSSHRKGGKKTQKLRGRPPRKSG